MKKSVLLLPVLAIGVWALLPEENTIQESDSAEPRAEFEEPKNPYPNDHWMDVRSYPDGFDQTEFMLRLTDVKEDAAVTASARDIILSNPWQEEGPNNIGGRFNAIEGHPTDPDILYAGSSNGGIFKTTDGGSSWNPIFDDYAYMAIGEIKLDPTDPTRVWVGTGDRNFGGSSHMGNGLYLSTDEGSSWTNMGLSEAGIISEIHIDPTDPDRMFVGALGDCRSASTDRGVYRTTDGGLSWTNVLFVSDSSGVCDMVMDPTNPDILYACFFNRLNHEFSGIVSGPDSKIFKTTDGGDSWTELGGGLPANESRCGIDIVPSSPNTLYAIFVDNGSLNPEGIYRSTDGGTSWTDLDVFSGANPLDPGCMGGFGWYFGQIHVNPYDESQLIVQGVDQWYSPDGGANWFMNVPDWWTYEVHADKHDIHYTSATTGIIATDGGLYESSNLSSSGSWTDIEDIANTQFYHIDVNPLIDGLYGGGAQDNGSMSGNGSDPTNWDKLFGGDGFRQTWLELDPDAAYYETQLGGLYYDGPSGFNDVSPPVWGDDRVNWDMPFLIDEDNGNLFVGTSKMMVMEAAPWGGFDDISSDLTDVAFGSTPGVDSKHTISEIEQDQFDSGILYAGTTDGLVWRGEGSGTSYDWYTISGSLPDKYVTALRASPDNPGTIFCGFSGFRINDFESYLYRSDDYGASWTDVGGDLPSLSVNDVLVVPNYDDEYLFAALDGGVYFTSNGGDNWTYVGTGLPLVTISELDLDVPNEKLIAGTYARSIWSYDISWIDSLGGIPPDTTGGVGLPYTPYDDFLSYPNPVEDLLYFKNLNANQISIFSLSGQHLADKKVLDLTNYQQVNLSVLPAGTYIIQAGDKRKRIVVK